MKSLIMACCILSTSALAGCQDGSARSSKTDSGAGDSDSRSLVVAAAVGNVERMKQLIRQGADLDRPAPGKDVTPLLAAVFSGNLQAVELLLDAKAKIDTATSKGVTPLLQAVLTSKSDIAHLLIERGADVNARNSVGTSILVIACTTKDEAIARRLIEKGADVHVQTGGNRTTALMMASHHDLRETAKLLLDKGARTDPVDAHGKTALDYAKSPEMRELLGKSNPALKE